MTINVLFLYMTKDGFHFLVAFVLITSCGAPSTSTNSSPSGNPAPTPGSPLAPSASCPLFNLPLSSGILNTLPYGLAAAGLNLLAGNNQTSTNIGTLLQPQSGNPGVYTITPLNIAPKDASSEVKSFTYSNQVYWFMALSNSVIYFTLASGAISGPITITTGSSPKALLIDDFNGDSKPDLVVANRENNYLTLVSDVFGAASQSQLPVGSGPGHVQEFDVNGDGKQDLVTLNYTDKSVSICINNSTTSSLSFFSCNSPAGTAGVLTSGNQGNTIPLPTSIVQPYRLLVGNQIAISDFGGSTISFFSIAPTTSYIGSSISTTYALNLKAQVTVGSKPTDLIAIDDNIAVANLADNTVSILQNIGGTYTQTNVCPAGGSGPRALVAADLNSDGKKDLAVANGDGGGSVSILLAF